MGTQGGAIMSVQTMKQAIRQSIIADRAALPQELHARWSRDIAARLMALPQYQAAHCVLGYMSFGAEFDSMDWLRQTLADGKKLLLPKVDVAARKLALYHVQDLDVQLAPGAYGIREPLAENCPPAALDEADFILLPGTAFARDGARLGYGGGFYDKLLARMDTSEDTHATLAAAAFSMQLVKDVPQEATDRKVQWLVTETETIDCAATHGR